MTQFDLFTPRPAIQAPVTDDPWRGLRYYQAEACQAIVDGFAEHRSQMIVMCTGGGKTQVFSALARMWPGNVLVLAHREELVQQAKARLEQMTGELVEVEQAEQRASRHTRLVVGSLDTMRSQARKDRFGKDHFSLVIQDECHHGVAASYKKTLEFFDAKILGVTATPDRGDEQALGKVFDSVAYCFDILQGIEAGYLVPIRGRQVELGEIQLDGLSKVAGDLAKGQLDEVMVRAVEGIVHKTLELEPGRQGIAFFPGVKSAAYAAERFNALLPGSAVFLSADTPPDERKAAADGFRSGKFRYLCNCMIATEGFDAPSCDLIIQGRPTLSRALYAQMVGRGTRVLPGVVDSLDGQAEAEARRASIASSSKPDCIAEGQRVLTNVGLVPIESVTIEMKVWDGTGFVSHGGAILRGEREVIHYAGLTATADHRVYTEEGWKTFGECAAEQIRISVTGAGIACIQQSAGYYRGDCPREESPACTDGMHEVRRAWSTRSSQSGQRESGMPRMREPKTGAQVASPALLGCKGALHKPGTQPLQELRREGHPVRVLVANRYGRVGTGESWSAPQPTDRPNRQREGLCARESAAIDPQPESSAYHQAPYRGESTRVPHEAPRSPLCGRHAVGPNREEGIEFRADSGQVFQPTILETKRRVWDILDSGPFHRFTVEGLLVHNCMILDFVGNATKHALMTPEDLLGGDYSEAEVEEAKRKAKLEPGANAQKLLADARRELAAVAAAVRSKVQGNVRNFNPFQLLNLDLTSTTREDMRWGRTPATEHQKEALAKMKVPASVIASVSEREARKLLQERNKRHDAGLATYAQLAQLKRYGLDDQNVTFANAGKALTYIARDCNWNPKLVNVGQLSWLASGAGNG